MTRTQYNELLDRIRARRDYLLHVRARTEAIMAGVHLSTVYNKTTKARILQAAEDMESMYQIHIAKDLKTCLKRDLVMTIHRVGRLGLGQILVSLEDLIDDEHRLKLTWEDEGKEDAK